MVKYRTGDGWLTNLYFLSNMVAIYNEVTEISIVAEKEEGLYTTKFTYDFSEKNAQYIKQMEHEIDQLTLYEFNHKTENKNFVEKMIWTIYKRMDEKSRYTQTDKYIEEQMMAHGMEVTIVNPQSHHKIYMTYEKEGQKWKNAVINFLIDINHQNVIYFIDDTKFEWKFIHKAYNGKMCAISQLKEIPDALKTQIEQKWLSIPSKYRRIAPKDTSVLEKVMLMALNGEDLSQSELAKYTQEIKKEPVKQEIVSEKQRLEPPISLIRQIKEEKKDVPTVEAKAPISLIGSKKEENNNVQPTVEAKAPISSIGPKKEEKKDVPTVEAKTPILLIGTKKEEDNDVPTVEKHHTKADAHQQHSTALVVRPDVVQDAEAKQNQSYQRDWREADEKVKTEELFDNYTIKKQGQEVKYTKPMYIELPQYNKSSIVGRKDIRDVMVKNTTVNNNAEFMLRFNHLSERVYEAAIPMDVRIFESALRVIPSVVYTKKRKTHKGQKRQLQECRGGICGVTKTVNSMGPLTLVNAATAPYVHNRAAEFGPKSCNSKTMYTDSEISAYSKMLGIDTHQSDSREAMCSRIYDKKTQ
jgi:hypothetical protein